MAARAYEAPTDARWGDVTGQSEPLKGQYETTTSCSCKPLCLSAKRLGCQRGAPSQGSDNAYLPEEGHRTSKQPECQKRLPSLEPLHGLCPSELRSNVRPNGQFQCRTQDTRQILLNRNSLKRFCEHFPQPLLYSHRPKPSGMWLKGYTSTNYRIIPRFGDRSRCHCC
jgi:hypothetical protein